MQRNSNYDGASDSLWSGEYRIPREAELKSIPGIHHDTIQGVWRSGGRVVATDRELEFYRKLDRYGCAQVDW